ncbi:MAG: U32 family peptidase [Ruminococcaceae bacterium]|nr:U32 family peptidase [Oscillospiraceae bacterium]
MLPELLAPVGNPQTLDAAIEGGADAVYLGGTLFNARMNARNFDRPALKEAVEKCHSRGVKLYVTLNTQILDRQMQDALNYTVYLYNIGVDALIVADLGLARRIKEILPDFPLHASTQTSGHNTNAARYLADLGFSRMVLARELSRENICYITQNSPIETEVFVHGALCVCHSGQCLMSSVIGGRSGNRGECAQPCRLPYNGKYPLSLKDNCLGAHIPDLIKMGVSCLKIEGRMKGPDYVYSTVSAYRKLLDENRPASAKEIDRMASVFSRGGFTDGYYVGKIDHTMLGIRSEQNKADTASIKVQIRISPRSLPPILLARKEAAPVISPDKKSKVLPNPGRSARFYKAENIPDSAMRFLDILYLPLDRFDGKKANGVIFPAVIPDGETETVRQALLTAKETGAIHALVGNIGHFALAKECGFVVHGDFRLNINNSRTAEEISTQCVDYILSPELILPQIRDIGGEKSVIVYGRIPLMLLEKPIGSPALRDRKGVTFPILQEGGRDILFNCIPTYMADRKDQLKLAGVRNEHFIFTVEGKRESEAILEAYEKGLATKKEVRRIK